MRSMINLLLKSVNKISGINKKIAQINNKEPDNEFTDNMRSMIYSLLQSVNKVSEINKKIAQTYDKVTTYPYGTNAFKVCESEMLSKNKLNRLDEDKKTLKDKDKDKTDSECKDENKFVIVYSNEVIYIMEGDDWIQKKKFFWSFGIIIIYLNYVKIGHSIIIIMYT